MTDPLRQAYAHAFAHCEHSLHRHQPQSLKHTMAALAATTGADEEADYYGQGSLTNEFELQLSTLLGKPAGLFMPSGTLAQPLALRIWADLTPTSHVALHPTSHLVLHEQQGYETLWQLKGSMWGQAEQLPTLAQLQALHQAQPLSAVLIELPMRELGGILPDWRTLTETCDWARSQGIKTHLDGARLWQCPAPYQKTLAEIAALFDSVYVSFYKDLGGLAGAMLLGETDFIDQARVWQRRAGGNLHTLAPYVIAAREGLKTHLPQMPQRHEQAKWLARALNALPGIQTTPEVPHTSMFRLSFRCQPQRYFQLATEWMQTHHIGLIPPPYSVSEQEIRAEISIGDAFNTLPKETWAAHLNNFAKAVIQ